MTFEEARNELKSYSKLVIRSRRLLEQSLEIEEKIKSAGGQKITGLPSAQGKVNDLSDYVVTLEELRHRREQTIKKIANIELKIGSMENDEYAELLTHRYKREECWSEVGQVVKKSESWARCNNRKAIEEYAKIGVE